MNYRVALVPSYEPDFNLLEVANSLLENGFDVVVVNDGSISNEIFNKLSEKKNVKVEVQLRTIAMDFWASLEHKLKYKKNLPEEKKDMLSQELIDCANASAELDQRMQNVRNIILKGE